MVKKRITNKMVAERAGVSQTTVSFVLNNVKEQNISKETTDRVLEAARELGYVPDAAARSLARGISDTIGLVLTRPHEAVVLDHYLSRVMSGIMQVVRQSRYELVLELVDSLHQSDAYLNFARGKRAAGIIVIPYVFQQSDIDTIKSLTSDGFPIVSMGWYARESLEESLVDSPINCVYTDTEMGVMLAVEHLIHLGHRRIGTISYAPESSTFTSSQRLGTYQHILSKHGLSYDKELVQYGEYTAETGYDAMNNLLDLKEPPTAVFALNDVMAIAAISAALDRGLRVPEDIAVVGYDGIALGAHIRPSLTSVHAPDIEQGRLSAELLMRLINDMPIESPVIGLQPQLVIYDSCGHQQKSPGAI